MVGIFVCFKHERSVKFFFEQGVRNYILTGHLLNVWMTGAVKKIMTAKTKQIRQ